MPLLWISLSLIAGIVLASLFSLPAWAWFAISVFILLLFILLRFPQVSTKLHASIFTVHPYIFVLPFFFFLGAWRYQLAQPNIDAFHIAFYNDRTYELLITGTLAEPPDYRDTYTNLKINVEAIDSGSGYLPGEGLLLVRVA